MEMAMNGQLIFVYKANADLFSTVTDFAHKILSPSTYDCKLCALTYGNFSMKKDWKIFVEALPVSATFVHKNEFEKKHGQPHPLPAIFLLQQNTLNELVSAEEIHCCTSLDELKALVTEKLSGHAQHHHSNLP